VGVLRAAGPEVGVFHERRGEGVRKGLNERLIFLRQLCRLSPTGLAPFEGAVVVVVGCKTGSGAVVVSSMFEYGFECHSRRNE
jgi:hypothetical protein